MVGWTSTKTLKQVVENSWLNVLWRGHLLDVVLITWSENCRRSRHHWIVAESRKLAEAFFAEVCEWSSEVRGEILVFQDGDWQKNKELYESIKTATFNNVILPDSLRQQLPGDFEQFFSSRAVYEQYGIPWKRGALFIGPPGNGKTHTVKALINQLGQPCLYVKGFKTEYATEQENMGAVFSRARMSAPCLLVLEDIDSMIDDENRSFFLNELDGFENNTGLVVLATTNHPDRLDPAILDRPSRFDRKYYFELPAAAERLAYVTAWNNRRAEPAMRNLIEVTQAGISHSQEGGFAPALLRTGSVSDRITVNHPQNHDAIPLPQRPHLSEGAVREVVEQTENFSFAYMKELFLSATMQWMSTRAETLKPNESSGASMDEIILEQAVRLRAQMTANTQT